MHRRALAIAICTAWHVTATAVVAAAQGTSPINPPIRQPGDLGIPTQSPPAQIGLENWGTDGTSLFRTCQFEDATVLTEFIEDLNSVARDLNHDPDLQQAGTTLEILTTTHDTGGLTDLDYALAREAERLTEERDARCVPERLAAIREGL